MNLGLSLQPQYGAESMAKQPYPSSLAQMRSLREQLTDRISGHQAQIDNLRAALDALTPDVERALDALQKL